MNTQSTLSFPKALMKACWRLIRFPVSQRVSRRLNQEWIGPASTREARAIWTQADERALIEARRLHRPSKHLAQRKTDAIHAELRAPSRWRGA